MRLATGLCLLLSFVACERRPIAPFGKHPVVVPVGATVDRLVEEEDTDGDKKITVEDRPTGEPGRGDHRFELRGLDGREYELTGVYHLSNLLQELKFAELDGREELTLEPERILELPTARISRLIRERYWDGLTRRIDADHLDTILEDEKTGGGVVRNFYVAHDDPDVLRFFDAMASSRPGLRLHVVRLPEFPEPESYDALVDQVLAGESAQPGSLHYVFLPRSAHEGTERIHALASEHPGLRVRVETLPGEIPRDLLACLSTTTTDRGNVRRVSYLYVPSTDEQASRYFQAVATERAGSNLRVEPLPQAVTPGYVQSLRGHHGLLSLALDETTGGFVGVPFVVPGGRFNEMYGWDSYFETEGLLQDGRVDLSRAMVDNFVYQIRYYGKILNANRSYYLTRSQPPFFTSMVLAVYDRLERNDASRRWLGGALWAAIDEYENVWTGPDHLDAETGLSRYFGTGLGQPPEVEPGHFDDIYARIATETGLVGPEVECRYGMSPHPPSFQSGTLSQTGSDKVDPPSLPAGARDELDAYFVNDRCMRESGHDTTYRWDIDGNRCADFLTVDLNSLLYKEELDLARTIERELGGELRNDAGRVSSAEIWRERARRRRERIRKYLWDGELSLFFDYDRTTGKRHDYVAATTLYPLWAWDPNEPSTSILEEDEIERFLEVAVGLLKAPGGVLASTEASRGPLTSERKARQWDYPNGWAPHQMIAWQGLISRGYDNVAEELVYRWLYTITRNGVDYNGTIPEKFNVVERSHQVFAEYGNVGTKFDYITEEGFGWMNASYQVGLAILKPEYRDDLDRLIPPEELFER